MREISYPYIWNQLRKGLGKAVALGVVFLLIGLGFSSFIFKKQNIPMQRAYGSYKVIILDELAADSAIETYETVTRILATSVKSTVFKQEFLDFAEGKEWISTYNIHNLGDAFVLNVGSRNFDIEVSSSNPEFTRNVQDYLLRHFGKLEEYLGIRLRVEAKDIPNYYEHLSTSPTKNTVLSALIFFLLGFVGYESIVAFLAQCNTTIKGERDLEKNSDLEVYRLGENTEILRKKIKGKQMLYINTVNLSSVSAEARKVLQLQEKQLINNPLDYPEELTKISLGAEVVLLVVKEKTKYNQLTSLASYLEKLECQVLAAVVCDVGKKTKYDLPC